jgi:hypothetical protein
MMNQIHKLQFLYTNIGRGHPFYLDGIIEAMVRSGRIGIVRGETDVFELSSGLSLLSWEIARYLYRKGSSGGLMGHVYRLVRSGNSYDQPSASLRLMGRDIRKAVADMEGPIIVAHPSLVGILSGRQDLLYQHGEVIAPSESLVRGASTVFVPTEEVAAAFRAAGYEADQVVISGLCIEPPLVKLSKDSFEQREIRLGTSENLVGALFSSGAEPLPHLEMLLEAAISTVCNKGHVFIFASKGGQFERRASAKFHRNRIALTVLTPGGSVEPTSPGATLVTFASRREENSLTARLFPYFDYLVAPSHERTNWALGLGLPMLVVTPLVGPFSPLNLKVMTSHGVAVPIDSMSDARQFGQTVRALSDSGGLLEMARNGWGRHPIDGFHRIAEFLHRRYGPSEK